MPSFDPFSDDDDYSAIWTIEDGFYISSVDATDAEPIYDVLLTSENYEDEDGDKEQPLPASSSPALASSAAQPDALANTSIGPKDFATTEGNPVSLQAFSAWTQYFLDLRGTALPSDTNLTQRVIEHPNGIYQETFSTSYQRNGQTIYDPYTDLLIDRDDQFEWAARSYDYDANGIFFFELSDDGVAQVTFFDEAISYTFVEDLGDNYDWDSMLLSYRATEDENDPTKIFDDVYQEIIFYDNGSVDLFDV